MFFSTHGVTSLRITSVGRVQAQTIYHLPDIRPRAGSIKLATGRTAVFCIFCLFLMQQTFLKMFNVLRNFLKFEFGLRLNNSRSFEELLFTRATSFHKGVIWQTKKIAPE
jgi:hypothetical protein